MSSQSILSFAPGTPAARLNEWLQFFDTNGTTATQQFLGDTPVIIAHGPGVDTQAPAALAAPVAKVAVTGDFRLGRRELRPEGTIVRIGDAAVGDGSLNVFAGPCAVENQQQMLACADIAANYGSVGLRGGAFKPRTSPYSFQGLKWAGLELLAEARQHTGLPILTEVLDPRHVERVAEIADGLQIGATGGKVTAALDFVELPSEWARNVVAIIPGSDPALKGQYVAIGSHNDHVGFGGPGPHFCLGAHLARREITVMFRELFRRMPDIRAVGEPDRLQSNFINGIKHLPAAWTPARAA